MDWIENKKGVTALNESVSGENLFFCLCKSNNQSMLGFDFLSCSISESRIKRVSLHWMNLCLVKTFFFLMRKLQSIYAWFRFPFLFDFLFCFRQRDRWFTALNESVSCDNLFWTESRIKRVSLHWMNLCLVITSFFFYAKATINRCLVSISFLVYFPFLFSSKRSMVHCTEWICVLW